MTAEWVQSDWPHTCTVLRQEIIGEDAYRQDIYGPWEPVATGVICQYWWVAGGERTDPRREIVEYEYWLLVPRSLDIRETDRIGPVYDADGVQVSTSEMGIESIGLRATAQLVKLREVR